MAIKLSKLSKAKTSAIAVEIKDPHTGEVIQDDTGNKVIAWVYGKASKEHREFEDKNLQEALTKRKSARNGVDPFAKDLTVGKIRDTELDYPVAMTKAIDGLETDDGKPYNTPELIRSLYEDKSLYYILDQVTAALADETNFI